MSGVILPNSGTRGRVHYPSLVNSMSTLAGGALVEKDGKKKMGPQDAQWDAQWDEVGASKRLRRPHIKGGKQGQ